jgi:hypothetical protein
MHNHKSKTFYRVRSNQSLKLTEPAVDDLAARQKNFLRKWRVQPRV